MCMQSGECVNSKTNTKLCHPEPLYVEGSPPGSGILRYAQNDIVFLMLGILAKRHGTIAARTKKLGENGRMGMSALPNSNAHTIIVMHGDQTGEELLQEALRVLDPKVIGLELDFQHFDLSLEKRRATQ